jgi:NAD+ diphosphatase
LPVPHGIFTVPVNRITEKNMAMDHTAKFAADSLHKQYPEPAQVPGDSILVLVRDNAIYFRHGSEHTIFTKRSPDITDLLKGSALYLGHLGSAPCYAYEIPGEIQIPENFTCSGVRELAGKVPPEELAIAGLAVQIIDFDRTTRFCGKCGAMNHASRTERAKICPACHYVTYARISPAIIVLVRNNDSILLVHGKQAHVVRYSLVAGFIEPGETIEHAVHREVKEETGIAISNVRYIASEPWPFPNSLMIGFVADYAGGPLTPDGAEIETAGWFDRNHLPDLPPKLSIARMLIDSWKSGNDS